MAQTSPKIDKLGLIPVFMDIGAATLVRSFTSPFYKSRARTYRRDVLFASLREILSGFSVEEGQYLSPHTDKVYKNVSKSKKWKENSVDLDYGAKGHWLGHSNAKYVMIYFHGGGYIAPATPGHMKYQFALQKYLRKQGIDISVLSLSYHLAPKGIYPMQIKQALAALQYVVEKEGRDPSTIIIAGDSAGGNLASALLLHLGRPHPDVSPKEGGEASPLRLKTPLKAAVLISPWISFETESPSFKTNATSDYLTIEALNRASGAFVGAGNLHDEYSEPIKAPVEHWKDVANHAVESIMIWGGGGEVLIDGIKQFGAQVIEGFGEANVSAPAMPVTTDPEKIEAPPTINATAADSEVKEVKDAVTEGPAAPEKLEDFTPITPAPTKIDSPANTDALVQTEAQSRTESPVQTFASAETSAAALPPVVNGEEKKIAVGKDRVTLVVTPHEAHEEMIIDYVLLIRDKGEGAKAIENWLTGVLKE